MSDPTPVERVVARVDVLVDMGRIDEAAEVIGRAVLDHPQSASLLIHLARVELLRGDYPAAVEAAGGALVSEPDSPSALRMLASGLSGTGKPYEALSTATAAIEQDPYDPHSYSERAAVLFSNATVMRRPGRLSDRDHNLNLALENIDQAIELSPHWPSFHVFRGQILKYLVRIPEARQAWEHALTIDPTNSEALGFLTEVDLNAERLGRARQHVEAGLGVDPQSAHLRRQAGRLATRRMLLPLWLASVPTGLSIVFGGVTVAVATLISIAYALWWWARLPAIERRTLVSGSAQFLFRLGVVAWIAFTVIGLVHLVYVMPTLAPGEEPSFGDIVVYLPMPFFYFAPVWWLIQRGWALGERLLERRRATRRNSEFDRNQTPAPANPNQRESIRPDLP